MADEDDDLEQSVKDTENELLEGAFAPEEKPEEEEISPRARDPQTGRFTKGEAAPAEEKPPEAEPQAQTPAEKPDEEILPSWRAREINEERRRTQAELEALRVEHARLQGYIQQQRAAVPPAPKAELPPLPDPVLDYPGYAKAVQERIIGEFDAKLAYERQQAATRELNKDLKWTARVHGEKFEKAFEALVVEGQRGNNQLVRNLISQDDPGEAIMRWHANETVLKTVGSDPDAFIKKTRDALLNDPEFLAQAAERAREVATGGQPRPNTVVRMPPSLSRATGTGDLPTTATDGSEAAIFANAFKPNRR